MIILDLFLHEGRSSVGNHWQYQHEFYYEPLDQKFEAFIWFIFSKHACTWKCFADSRAYTVIRYNFNQARYCKVIFCIDFLYLKRVFHPIASWDENAWIMKSRSSPKFILVLDISQDLFIWKMWFYYLSSNHLIV